MNTIFERKSVRTYLDKEVEIDKLTQVLAAANAAPIYGHVEFIVITNKEVLNQISSVAKEMMLNSNVAFLENLASMKDYNPTYNAPVNILIATKKTSDPLLSKNNSLTVGCAAQNIMLMATELGLGTCFTLAPTLAFMNPSILKLAQIEADEEIGCLITLGYEAEGSINREREELNNIRFVK